MAIGAIPTEELAKQLDGAGQQRQTILNDPALQGNVSQATPGEKQEVLLANSPGANVQTPRDNKAGATIKAERHTTAISDELMQTVKEQKGWSTLPETDKQRFIDVAEYCLRHDASSTAQKEISDSLLRLLNTSTTDRNGQNVSVLLHQDKDNLANAEERTVLGHLHKLTNCEVKEAVQPVRDRYLVGLIKELADPQVEINQGKDTTCAPTTNEGQQSRKDPAEYARIVSELAINGKARLCVSDTKTNEVRLAVETYGEPMFKLASNTPSEKELGGRSYSEYFYQKAAMEYAGAVDGGLYNGASEKLAEHLFGKAARRIDGNCQYDEETTALRKSAGIDTNAGKTAEQVNQEILTELKRTIDEGNGGYNMAALKWGAKGDLHQNHVTEVVDMDGSSVYIRNPWGKDFLEVPSGINATLVDSEKAIYKMPKEEFCRLVNSVLVSADESHGKVAFGITKGSDEEQPDMISKPGMNRTIFFPVEYSQSRKQQEQAKEKKIVVAEGAVDVRQKDNASDRISDERPVKGSKKLEATGKSSVREDLADDRPRGRRKHRRGSFVTADSDDV